MNLTSILFDASLKGSALVVLAWLITLTFSRASAAAKHVVWGAALGGVLLIPILSAVVPRIPIRALQPISATSLLSVRASSPSSASSVSPAPSPRADAVLRQRARARAVGPSGSMTLASAAPRARTIDAPAGKPYDIMRFLPAIWLTVSVLVLLRIVLGALRVSLWARRAQLVDDGAWLSLVQRIAAQLRITRPVVLLQSERACVPMTWGVVYPTVLLPADVDEWTSERRTIVLLHEMAHVKRLDALTQLLAQVVVALFWFNPLVWLAARQMRTEREHACDDFVLEGGARATDYAYDLLQIARSLGGSAPATALAMARPSELEGRLLAILDPDTNHRGVSRTRLALASACALLLALPLAAFAPASPVTAVSPVPKRILSPQALLDTTRKMPVGEAPRAVSWESPRAPMPAPMRAPKATTPPDRETLIAVAKAASKMSSGYEKAELLITIAKHYAQDAELCKAYIDVVSSIASDNDRARAMLALLNSEAGASAPARDAVIVAAGTLTSDFTRGQAIAAIAKSGDLTNKQTIDLVSSTSTMANSYEKANALIGIMSYQPIGDADVRKAILKAAETIASAPDYRRVVSAILK